MTNKQLAILLIQYHERLKVCFHDIDVMLKCAESLEDLTKCNEHGTVLLLSHLADLSHDMNDDIALLLED